MSILLEAEHLTKIFTQRGKNPFKAVNDVSFTLKKGETLGIVGESGCGKSTTLRMIAGLEEVSDGELYIGDRKVNDVPPKDRDIAMVFQSYALYPHMTVYKNMAFALELRKVPKDEIDKKVREAAKILGLEEYLKRKPKELSGGQRQRVALGRAMVRQPAVFLLDEPLSNLDAKLRIRMRDELKELQKKTGITMIFVTHDQEEAMALADKIAIMEGGRLIQMGAPREVYQNPASLFVMEFLGTADRAAMPDGSLIYFRPEDIRILGKAEETKARKDKGTERQAQNPDGRHLLTGTIVKSDYMGFYTQYFVKTEGGELLVREFEREYQNGDLVALELCGGKTF